MSSMRFILGFSAYVLLFAWFDWIIYRSVLFVVFVGGGLIVAMAFRHRIAEAVRSAAYGGSAEWMRPIIEVWHQLSWKMQRLLIALLPLLYFLLRGQGSSSAGSAVLVAGLLVATATIYYWHRVDPKLQEFYAARDRLLARWVRLLLAPVLGVLIAFLVVHGSLLDLPALFGGTTNAPQFASGMSWRYFLATVLAGGCTVLLLREGRVHAS